jgi:predicted nucleotidyltransferase
MIGSKPAKIRLMNDIFSEQQPGKELGSQMAVVDSQFPIMDYLDAVRQTADTRRRDIVSIWIFGSASIGGFSSPVSDVDLMIVLADDVTQDIKSDIRCEFEALERKHGLRTCPKGRLEHLSELFDQKVGGFKSLTLCYRRDLLSGNVSAVFEANALAEFVNNTTHLFCFASIVNSAHTIWGEDLIARIPIPAITNKQFSKMLITHCLRNTFAFLVYPILPNGTKYSMAILKGFLHNCYFVYKAKGAPIQDEIHFFRTKIGESKVLAQLLSLRETYRPSPGFIIRCFQVLVRLYAVTLKENRFPFKVVTPHASKISEFCLNDSVLARRRRGNLARPPIRA